MALGSNPLLEEVIVGIMLGDGWMEKQKVNARLRFEQSHSYSKYIGFQLNSVALALLHTSTFNSASLNPWFITGFSDAEGCFMIIFNKKGQKNYQVQLIFQIHLHKKDLSLLEKIKSSLGGVGSISKKSTSIQWKVSSQKDLQVIVDHFDKYPLISQKAADYMLFKQAFNLILSKGHLSPEGLQKLVAIKASINKGLPESLKTAFPHVTSVPRPLVKDTEIKDPYWLAGFVSGEGCFYIQIFKDHTKTGFTVRLRFGIGQHSRDAELLKSLINYLGCGQCYPRSNQEAIDFYVTRYSDITNNIIPFFEKYRIEGVKYLDYEDFKRAVNIMKVKSHLTEKGLEEIRLIKAGMNKGRID
jgi:hypothetical protein